MIENSKQSPTETQTGFWNKVSPEAKLSFIGVIAAALIAGFFAILSNSDTPPKRSTEVIDNEKPNSTREAESQTSDGEQYLSADFTAQKLMRIMYSRSHKSDRKYLALEYEGKYIPKLGWLAKVTERSVPAYGGGHIIGATSDGVHLRVSSAEDLRNIQVGDEIRISGKVYSIDANSKSAERDFIFISSASIQFLDTTESNVGLAK